MNTRRARRWLAGVGAVLAAGLFAWGVWINVELSIRGVTVTGKVVAHMAWPGRTHDEDNYVLRYIFVELASGASIADDATVDHLTWMTTADGDEVGVTYLPERPTTSRLVVRSTDLVGTAAVLALLLLVMIVSLVAWARQRRRGPGGRLRKKAPRRMGHRRRDPAIEADRLGL